MDITRNICADDPKGDFIGYTSCGPPASQRTFPRSIIVLCDKPFVTALMIDVFDRYNSVKFLRRLLISFSGFK